MDNRDASFLRELLNHVEHGRVVDVMVIATDTKTDRSIIVGPGLDKQLAALEMAMTLDPAAQARMQSGAVQPTAAQALKALQAAGDVAGG